jgi:2-iminobutanoate/2-iminopropanoate deaminase
VRVSGLSGQYQEKELPMRKTIFLLIGFSLILGCSQKAVERRVITCPDAPGAIGPYSQAVQVGNRLYLSGQLGIDPETGSLADGFQAQAIQALENLKTILSYAGFSMEDVVQTQVFVTDLENYGAFNTIYSGYFQDDFPSRAVLQVSRIPADGLVEIMMVAEKTI